MTVSEAFSYGLLLGSLGTLSFVYALAQFVALRRERAVHDYQ